MALTIGAFLYSCAEAPELGIPDEEPMSEAEAEVLDGASAASHGGRTVRRISGNGQRGDAGKALSQPFVAQVVDGSGRPIDGLLVNWAVTTGNGEVDKEWVRTDTNGRVQARFTMGTDVPKQRTVARIDGARITFVALANESGGSSGPAGSVVVAPTEMQLSVGESESFRATVYGDNGKVDGNASVRWNSSDKSVATVNSSGTVTALALGSTDIIARSGDNRSKSALRVVEGSSGGGSLSIARVSGNGQTGGTEEQLKEPLRVRVRNGGGGAAVGAGVKWSVIQGSGSVSETRTRTDASGHAQVAFTLGKEEAAQKVRASVSGKRVTFTAMAEGSGGGSGQMELRRDGGNGQTGSPGEVLPAPMRVRLLDGSGDPVQGMTVDWNVEAGGGSLSASSTTTNAEGRTQIRVTLGSQEGENRVRARIEAGPNVSFTATAGSGGGGGGGTVATVRVEPGSFTLGGPGATRSLTATGSDDQGNPVSGVSFEWASSNAGVATVNSNGVVTARGSGSAEITATADCCSSPAGTAQVTVEDSDPPPPPSGDFPNLPSNWRVINDNPWNSLPNWNSSCPAQGGVNGRANGWGKVISSGPGGCPEGEGAIVQLSDAPDGDPNVFRMTYNPGHPGGEDGYGVFYSPGEEGHASREIYFAVWFRFGERGDAGSFKRHGNGLKMFSFDGSGGGQRTNMHWSDLNFGGGPCPDAFAVSAPDGPFGDADNWTSAFPGYDAVAFRASCMNGQEHHQRGFYAHPDQGYDPSVRMRIGEWALVEIKWETGPNRIRWWWNGRLAGDFSGGTIPYPIHDVLIDGTWGGGPSSIPRAQNWYIARSIVAVP